MSRRIENPDSDECRAILAVLDVVIVGLLPAGACWGRELTADVLRALAGSIHAGKLQEFAAHVRAFPEEPLPILQVKASVESN